MQRIYCLHDNGQCNLYSWKNLHVIYKIASQYFSTLVRCLSERFRTDTRMMKRINYSITQNALAGIFSYCEMICSQMLKMCISNGYLRRWLLKLAETASVIITRFKVLLGVSNLFLKSQHAIPSSPAEGYGVGVGAVGILIPPPNEHIHWIKAHV